MNPIAIKIGSHPIYWYGIIMSTAILLGSLLAAKRAEKENINPDHIFNLIIIVIPAAFIMARLYYVVFEWPQYAGNWKEIIAIWHGGLAIHGGLIGGFLAGFFYVKWQKLLFWQFADIIAPSIILGQAIGRWGNFFNQEAHGGVVSKAFIQRFPEFIQKGMLIQGQYYNPTFLYESLWNFAILGFLLWFASRPRKLDGQITFLYFMLYSVGRFVIEGMRTDSLMLGPIRVAQLVSLGLIVISIIGLLIINRKKKTVH